MEDFLVKLKKTLVKKDLISFWIFPDLDTFKPIKMYSKDIEENFQKNINKYKNRNMANIKIFIEPRASDKQAALTVKVSIQKLTEDATFPKNVVYNYDNIWHFTLFYLKSDLEKKQFKIDDVFQLSKLVSNSLMPKDTDVYYTRFQELLKDLKQKLKKNKNFKYD